MRRMFFTGRCGGIVTAKSTTTTASSSSYFLNTITTSSTSAPPAMFATPKRLFREASTQKAVDGSEVEEDKKDADLAYNIFKYTTGAVILIAGTYWANEYAKKKYAVSEGTIQVSYVKTHGKPNLGGPFVLVDTEGRVRSQRDFLGSWCFFYFGFTNCPEICPVELNRMSKVVDGLRERIPSVNIQPLFVSCDPLRDDLEKVDEYVKDFHKDFVGMVGTPEQVDRVCKSYRIYYSLPDEKAQASGDYLIDHSIAIFLFDPQGRFVDFFGSRYSETEILDKVEGYVHNYMADPTWTTW
eukprot:PhM_4_TR10974/c0_g1_i1/m.17685/K07152/SCO1_2; protein SCO1/2